MSRWALEYFCRSVAYFLLIAPIFFLESNTFVGISARAVCVFFFFFSKYVSSPRQSSVKKDTQVFGSFSLRNLVSIQCDCGTVIPNMNGRNFKIQTFYLRFCRQVTDLDVYLLQVHL